MKWKMQLRGYNIGLILYVFVLLSCTGTAKEISFIDSKENPIKEIFKDSLVVDSISGVYGVDYPDLFLVNQGNSVCGYYFYFDDFDEKTKQYVSQNVFTFRSDKKINDSIYSIKANNYGDILHGKLIIQPSTSMIYLTLESQPRGYAAYDFEDEGYKSSILEHKSWFNLAIINRSQVNLYENPSEKSQSVDYLSENDVVAIISDSMSSWYKIEYISPVNFEKRIIKYIKKEDVKLLGNVSD